MTDKRISTTPGYVGGLVTGHIRPPDEGQAAPADMRDRNPIMLTPPQKELQRQQLGRRAAPRGDTGQAAPACRKCGGSMRPGKAMGQTYTGSPDFPGDTHATTISPGGPGKLVDCMKCEKCGWSVSGDTGQAAPGTGAGMEADALRTIMRMADAAKEQCGMDPESPAAIRNGKFASIAMVAAQGLGLVHGPAISSLPPAAPGVAPTGEPRLSDVECWEQGKPDSIDRAMAYEAAQDNIRAVASVALQTLRNHCPQNESVKDCIAMLRAALLEAKP